MNNRDTSRRSAQIMKRFYGMLMKAYPRQFRQEYEIHMRQVFSDQVEEKARNGELAALLALMLRTVADLAATALVQRAHSLGITSLWGSTKGVVREPNHFFSRMPNGYTKPLVFALFWGVFASIVSGLYSYVGADMVAGSFGAQAYLLSVAVSPLGSVVSAFATAFVIQLGVRFMLGNENEGYETTFRVACYATVSNVFLAVPFVGGLMSIVYSIYLSVVGLRQAHRTTTTNAADALIAVGIPFLLIVFVPSIVVSEVFGGLGDLPWFVNVLLL